MHDAYDTLQVGTLFGTIRSIPPLETRLAAFSLIGPLFRTLLCSLLSLFPSQLPCIAYLSHIQYCPLRLAWAKRRIADRSFPPFRSRACRLKPYTHCDSLPRVLGSLERVLGFILLFLTFLILELTRGDFLPSSQCQC